MAQTFRIEGIQPKDISLFRSLMTLIDGRLTSPWEFVMDGRSCDVVLIDIDTMGADELQMKCRHLVGSIPVIYGSENLLNSHFYLAKPARPMELVKLLNELYVYLHRDQGKTSQGYVDVFRPEEHFVGLLTEAAAQDKVVWLKHAEYPIILVDGKNKLVYTKASDNVTFSTDWLMKLESINREEVGLATVKPEKVHELMDANQLRKHSLDSVLWHFTSYCSNGALYDGVSAFQPLEIEHWPDLQSIGREPYVSKLAAYMLCHQDDLVTVANKTQTPFPRVVDFFNACLVAGYATHPSKQQAPGSISLTQRLLPFLTRLKRAESHC